MVFGKIRQHPFLVFGLLVAIIVSFVAFEVWFDTAIIEPQIPGKALELTKGISSDENKAIALNDWISGHTAPDLFPVFFNPGKVPFIKTRSAETAFYFGRGGCGEAARLFVKMAEAVGIEARVISNAGENHAWAEAYVNGKWEHFDPSNSVRLNPHYYEEEQHPRRQYSYIFWEEDGIKHNVTSTYTKTGRLAVKVYDGGEPAEGALVKLKGSYRPDLVATNGYTNSDGIFEIEVGDNNYTVTAEKDEWFLISGHAEEKAELLPGERREILLKLSKEPNYIRVLIVVLALLLVALIAKVVVAKYGSKDEGKKIRTGNPPSPPL